MNLSILKFIGLGVIGIGGAGIAIVFGSKQAREFVGLSSYKDNLSEENKQYQFLYKLSKKLFETLKQNVESDLYLNSKDNVIKWLKEKFFNSSVDETGKWQNFKSLCEEQKTKEKEEGKTVNNEYSRLCFMDSEDDVEKVKGYLWHWYNKNDLRISPDKQIEFLDFNKKNYDLWSEFKSQYPNANPIDKFDEWYDQSAIENSGLDLFKKVIDNLKVSSKVKN